MNARRAAAACSRSPWRVVSRRLSSGQLVFAAAQLLEIAFGQVAVARHGLEVCSQPGLVLGDLLLPRVASPISRSMSATRAASVCSCASAARSSGGGVSPWNSRAAAGRDRHRPAPRAGRPAFPAARSGRAGKPAPGSGLPHPAAFGGCVLGLRDPPTSSGRSCSSTKLRGARKPGQ